MKQQDRAHRKGWKRAKQAAAWLALLPVAALGWLYSRLPDRVYLTPGEVLALPRFSYVEPLGAHGSQNVASTRAVGSYQTTLSLGGWLPIKTIRTIVTERMQVTVCGTPFGVKMFSEGALVVGFSDVERPSGGTANPAKEAGLRLGDRVIRIGTTVTEDNDAVKAALEAAQGQAVEVVYIRNGKQLRTTLVPVWDAAAGQWRAGMWVRDSSAGVGTLTFADDARGIFAGLGHPISDSDTGESIALRTGEIVPCEITGCSKGTAVDYALKQFQLEKEDAYVFGDSSNDLTMFRCGAHTIALGKHDEILDPYTEYVTDTVERDGVAKAMEHYGLI